MISRSPEIALQIRTQQLLMTENEMEHSPFTHHSSQMPAPEAIPHNDNGMKTLGHVNLMVDTLIANATMDDLRAIIRSLIATGSPSLATAFTTAARTRLRQTNAKRIANAHGLFATDSNGLEAVHTPELDKVLASARSLYGAGMGFASLGVLASVVRATVGLRWEQEGSMSNILAVIDADISQALQSCKEEVEGGRANDLTGARDAVNDLWSAVEESSRDVETWGGEFPFDRAANSMELWKF
ncbi:hypothetical protein SERLA73DRAFT_191637 [Serpula lacrymans var. lacrymans S7.3]|uniref:Uncharacterized protein n=2 Tax=Serpula lacrymans var. lacrymans TaxID=341189 RepID=F8QI00_SERL3|nr:uncharacterized protein SERLADRAFT_459642 [Serpula lacrymans var. lacrymans S7.9]EGN92063.1 hypothetical protein SERLA73DRAFT_191637 [Serpula lacrymans var. lacrymans S7.3]EGO28817.1 hypothetical protein SERLADRAFT_459642 [Serpula lacrymans var. lacrymans S7.9]